MYDSCNANIYGEIIPSNTSKLNSQDGEVLVNDQTICNCLISECLTLVKNNRGWVEITNGSPNDVIFSMDRPVSAELFNMEFECNEISSDRVIEVLSRLRTEHLNAKELVNLQTLCADYADVFYPKGESLTFTNKIKHKIRTTDEVPVHTRSYRYP